MAEHPGDSEEPVILDIRLNIRKNDRKRSTQAPVDREATMRKSSATGIAGCVLMTAALLGATRCQAGILPYVQASNYPNSFNAITSQSQANGGNYQSFDNFTTGSTSEQI